VGLAQAILHDPELVILDEPMSGLDPVGRRQVRDLILELKAQGKTVIFSSHVLPDVEAVCDRVGILVEGVLRRIGSVRDLMRSDQTDFEIEVRDLPVSLRQSWTAEGIARKSGDRMVVAAPGRAEMEDRVQQVIRSGAALLAVRPVRASLEDVFLAELRETVPPADPAHHERRGAA